jgi:hypothetical protein
MDGSHFDDFTKALLKGLSRRRLVLSLAAGALSLVGNAGAEARACSSTGSVCRENANCCTGFCGAKNATGRRTCQCTTPANCPIPGACHKATCVAGLCRTVVTTGVPCDDGNACTLNTTCATDGRCRGVPKSCPDADACHTGVCEARTGECGNVQKTNGAVCTALCLTGTGSCQAGQCQGVPKTCAEVECQTGVCDATTGNCSYTPKQNGTDCHGGFACEDGVCPCTGCGEHGGGGGGGGS